MTQQNIKQSFLSPVEFRFVIKRLPFVTFFTQKASLPGASNTPMVIPTPFKKTYHSSDSLEYNQFTIDFRINESMDNYLEIYNWMVGLSFPNNFEEFANLNDSQDGLYSDASLLIMSNSRNPNILYKLKNIFPISLSDINLDTTVSDLDYISATATFQIDSFEVELLSNS